MNAMDPRFNPDGASVEGCFHRVRMEPLLWEKKHISDIVEDCYDGPYNDFIWQDLAHPAPKTIGVSETEEQGGEIWFTFRTAEQPLEAIRFVSRIAVRFPTLEVIHDYEFMPNELFGRFWYRHGTLFKECHLTPLPSFLRGI